MHFWEFFTLVTVGIPMVGLTSIFPMMIWTHHRRKMAELKLKENKAFAEDAQSEFASLRQEIRSLRDTTMQYDLSFDTALQQMERRMTHLEKARYSQTDSLQDVTVGR